MIARPRPTGKYSVGDSIETFTYFPISRRLEGSRGDLQPSPPSNMRSRQEGLTKLYNRFHDPNEPHLPSPSRRSANSTPDGHAVAAAYGWADLDPGQGSHATKQGIRYTISEPPAAKSSPAS